MGGLLTSIFGGGGRTTEQVSVDPTTQALNDIRLQELERLFGSPPATGPGANGRWITNAQGEQEFIPPDPGQPGIASFADFAGERPDIYSPTAGTQELLNYVSQMLTEDGGLLSMQDYIDLGLDESSNFISQVASPQILQTAALQGLEGGGIVPEAIGKATAGIALPFLQGLPAAQHAITSAPANLLGVTDFPRALQEQDFTRRQGLVTTGLTGLPYTPETSTKARQSQQPLFNLFGQG